MLNEGYWTFHMLKKEIESYGTVNLQVNEYNRTCLLTADIIDLKNFGPIIGFSQNKKQTIQYTFWAEIYKYWF